MNRALLSQLRRDVAKLVTDQVVRMERAASASFAVGSALSALWGASRGAASLMSALNDMFEREETRSWIRRQLVAIGTTLVVAGLLLVGCGVRRAVVVSRWRR